MPVAPVVVTTVLAHAAFNGGRYDQWIPAKSSTTMAYLTRADIPFHYALADKFTICDAYHCSFMGSTDPNRYYMWSASSGGLIDNNPPVASGGNQWETLFDRALKNNPANAPGFGPTVRYYNSDLPFSAVWGPRGIPWTRPVADYYAACASGTLENIVIVDPAFRDGSGGDGVSADEHQAQHRAIGGPC